MTAQKRPFDIDLIIERLRVAVRPYPPAAMFQLAAEGYGTLFEQLVACMLSIRTYDEVSLPAAKRLFALAHTPAAMVNLTPAQIEAAIGDVTFSAAKAPQIHTIAQRILDEFDGELPPDAQVLQSFKGVGPKCANLALGIAAGAPAISVDTHVHRVANRWGYVQTRTPEQTMTALAARLPERYWVEINRLLVPFGKHVCTGARPRCSTCLLLDMCKQVEVKNPR